MVKLGKERGILVVHIGSQKALLSKRKYPPLGKYHDQNDNRNKKCRYQPVRRMENAAAPRRFLPAHAVFTLVAVFFVAVFFFVVFFVAVFFFAVFFFAVFFGVIFF